MTYRIRYSVIQILVVFKLCGALNNGLALTPPMGWISWQRYRCTIDCQNFPNDCISENLFRKMADILANEGYKEAGYQYVIVDDCWLAPSRTSDGRLEADRMRFPNGMKNLSRYIHQRGLKFGIYEDYGNKTCEGYPGVRNNSMEKDARTFADWEVDYIKMDGCNSDLKDMDRGYPQFERQLNRTGRPMVYSCSWPAYQELQGMNVNYHLLMQHCNLWRNYMDIDDSWQSVTDIMDYYAMKQDFWQRLAGPGHWNDPDMLLIGNFGLSYDQSKVQMAVWSILAAPLIVSADLRNMKPEFKSILQNKAIIEVNQDILGIQGRRIFSENNVDVWIRPISPQKNGHFSYAVAFVNRKIGGAPLLFSTTLKNLGLYNLNGYNFYGWHFFERTSECEAENKTCNERGNLISLLNMVPKKYEILVYSMYKNNQ